LPGIRAVLSSLRFRLSLLILVAMLPALLLNMYNAVQQRRLAAHEAQLSALRITRSVADEQAHIAAGAQEMLTSLSMMPAIHTANAGECPRILSDLLAQFPRYTSLSVLTPAGDLVCRGLRPGQPAHVTGRAIESAYRRALDTGSFAVGEYGIGTLTRKPVVPFALPLLGATGEVEAVLTATLDLVWLSRFVGLVDLPIGGTLTISAADGRVLARYPHPERWVGERIPAAWGGDSLEGDSNEGFFEASGLDGVRRIYAFSRLPAPEMAPVTASVGTPVDQVFGAANRMLARNFFVLSLITLAAVIAGWGIGTRTLLNPIRLLIGATRRLAAGDLSARASIASTEGEVAELAGAFNEMAASLQQQTEETATSIEALRRSEQRYRTLVDATAAIVWSTPASGELTEPHPQWTAFTGQTFEQLRGWGWLDAVHPDDRAMVAHAWALALETRTLFQVEQRLRRRDGEYRHMMVRAVPIIEKCGRPSEWIGVHTDITERKRAEEDRAALLEREREARTDAERANRAKSDFLAIVSHELRTPLTSIISYAELIASDVGGSLSDKHREFVERIDASAWHLTDLVDQILEFTRLEAGRVVVRYAATDIRGVIAEATADVLPMAHAKGLSLQVRVPEHPAMLITDGAKVRQILLNLLSNAIKFSPEGEIELSATCFADRMTLQVRDSGPGIASEHLERIWDSFWQAENPLTRRAGGTGLGLAIVRRLSSLLGGSVYAESCLGEGSTFTVVLPRSSREEGPAEVSSVLQELRLPSNRGNEPGSSNQAAHSGVVGPMMGQ
jgi:PAS domain S-box-containing protein